MKTLRRKRQVGKGFRSNFGFTRSSAKFCFRTHKWNEEIDAYIKNYIENKDFLPLLRAYYGNIRNDLSPKEYIKNMTIAVTQAKKFRNKSTVNGDGIQFSDLDIDHKVFVDCFKSPEIINTDKLNKSISTKNTETQQVIQSWINNLNEFNNLWEEVKKRIQQSSQFRGYFGRCRNHTVTKPEVDEYLNKYDNFSQILISYHNAEMNFYRGS